MNHVLGKHELFVAVPPAVVMLIAGARRALRKIKVDLAIEKNKIRHFRLIFV